MTTGTAALAAWVTTLRSADTVHNFSVCVNVFFHWAGDDLAAVDRDLIESYVAYLKERAKPAPVLDAQLAWGSINNYILGLRLFLKYCRKRGYVPGLQEEDLDELLPLFPAVVVRPHTILTEEEIAALFKAAWYERDRCMIALGLYAGLRAAEIAGLAINQMGRDVEGPFIVVLGKGNKEAVVPISDSLHELLRSFSKQRAGSALFWDMGPAGVRGVVSRLAREASISRRITTHDLRHTYAFNLLKAGTPVAVISRMLRHSNLAITTVYLNHLSRADLAQYVPVLPS